MSSRSSLSSKLHLSLWALALVAVGCSPGGSAPEKDAPSGGGTAAARATATAPASEGGLAVLGAPSAGNLMIRGKYQLGAGHAKEALKLFRQAEEAGYSMADIHYYYGSCYQAMQDKGNMLLQYKEFIKLTKEEGERLKKAMEAIKQAETVR
ncbi:MAG: hypothetical protein FJ125_01510 [Deltaproteobacteria bacterium]|nr:hypothetical protein [Deltaproteobacteria bacterium]